MNRLSKMMKKYEEKPYNRCLNCAYIGKKCDGPNFFDMDISRLCEWCRLRKDYLYSLDPIWTNQHIADQANLSKVSVDRFLSGNVTDLKVSTASQILKVLVNGSWGRYPCEGVFENEHSDVDIQTLQEKCEQLQTAHDTMKKEKDDRIEFLISQLRFKEEQMRSKDKLLDERADFLRLKDRVIIFLSFLFAVCLTAIFFWLIAEAKL